MKMNELLLGEESTSSMAMEEFTEIMRDYVLANGLNDFIANKTGFNHH